MPDLRVRTVGTRVCEEEYQALEKLASARGQTLSEWTRQIVLAQLNPTIASSTEETVIAEVLALRTILLNALFRIVPHRPGREAHRRRDAKADRASRRRQD